MSGKSKLNKECGSASDSVRLLMKGGCGEECSIEEMYRCTGCGKWFHLKCILKHFELEEHNNNARYYLHKIMEQTNDQSIIDICKRGLEKQKPGINLGQ